MDPIAQMLNIINNGYKINQSEVIVSYSNFKKKIIELLIKNKMVSNMEIITYGKIKKIKIKLLSSDQQKPISAIRQFSKQGRKFYIRYRDLPKYLRSSGMLIISTPKGILTGKEAYQEKVGGEIICHIQ